MREFVSDFVLPFGFLVAVLLAAVAFGSGLADALTPEPEPIVSEPAPPPCGNYWVVGPGDTLWRIAALKQWENLLDNLEEVEADA